MTVRAVARWVGLAGSMFAAGTAAVHAQDSDAVQRGEAKYAHSCTPCHGRGLGDDGREMLPGTAALQIKYAGEIPAVLEDRPGLTAEVIRVFVRNGSWSMPPFRPTELTDAEIEDIAAYLAESSRAAAAAAQR
jgi:(+)-pinoresinol hydroxylase